ncbi:TetR/AcrR family transcriptional regulator C-terminal domain-containing protein [Actinosynnema pretiosum subsp. pretiosum]|uniref:TetR/AcrR family transcriptional regulator C-terminal domain-containing protein n=1 Tax=Actinosynnema pretiosum subsp. pretiosum TaxID=103721 RepID=A0AA45L7N9_9PSEU|nr:Transcriptional regulator, TetR family [Actinosynnema pretiosum subsp. pretiosum]QUF05114.1 TetR/AcrR family transcriptional regulator C-terminal domain-containing protein [Actinosynnema pretiosum subsp. pretiosum]
MSNEHDPARVLALLWRTDTRPTRRGGPGVDRIVAAAVALADEDGLAALSMRRVAEALGVGTMSLYTHVPGKAELVEAMVDAVSASTPREPATGGWRERLEAVARDNRALLLRHPWLLDAPLHRAVLGPGAIGKYEHELGAVDGIGLDEVEMDAVLTLVLGHVRATARAAVDAERARTGSGMGDEQWWAKAGPALAAVLDEERYPLAARVGAAASAAHRAPHDAEHAFAFGLRRVLDGVAALVGGRAGQ